jgi:hypothetical protein
MTRRTTEPSWTEQVDLDRYWTYGIPIAACGLAVGALSVVATSLPGEFVIPDGIVLLLFLVAVPVHVGTVASARQIRRGVYDVGHWPNALFGALPWVQRLVLLTAIGAGVVIVVLSIGLSRGAVERHGDRYLLRVKSNPPTEISRDEYVEQRKQLPRTFGATSTVFCTVAVGAGLGYRRRQALAPPPDPWPGPDLRPGPGSFPPARWPPT